MSTILAIAIAGVGAVGTLAAFGGETWSKGEEPILRRITRRGWLSLACLAATFCLAVTKEVIANTEARKADQVKLAVQQKAEKRQAEEDEMLLSLKDGIAKLQVTRASAQADGVPLPPISHISNVNQLQNETMSAVLSIAMSAEEQYTLARNPPPGQSAKGLYEGALQRFMVADRLGDIAAIKARVADTQFNLGNYEAAVEYERRAVALAPNWNGPSYMLALGLFKLGKAQEAIAPAERSCALGFGEACKLATMLKQSTVQTH